MAKPYEKLLRFWRQGGNSVQVAPQSEAAVAALELKYDLRLPEDFREYLLRACPTPDHFDERCTEWWSLDRIKNVPDEYEHELCLAPVIDEASRYLFFADYMVWAMAWAINCSEDEHRGKVVVISGQDRFVAESFAAFVDRYLEDHNALL